VRGTRAARPSAGRVKTRRSNRRIALVTGFVGGALVILSGFPSGGVSLAAPCVGPPQNTMPPAISGTVGVNRVITTTNGAWTACRPIVGYEYQWHRDDAAIPGATFASYSISSGDAGHTLRVRVTAIDDMDLMGWANSNTAVVPVPPSSTAPPSITGTAANGETLTVVPGTWSGSPATITRQWERCRSGTCSPIEGETETTYIAGEQDAAHTVRVVETAINDSGTASAASAQTSEIEGPMINGSSALKTADAYNFGIRYLCQNLAADRTNEADWRNGCRQISSSFQNCCGGDDLLGTRAMMKMSAHGWTVPDKHGALMRVVAEGGIAFSDGSVLGFLLQGGFAQNHSAAYPLDGNPTCASIGQPTQFTERMVDGPNGRFFQCSYFEPVAREQYVRVSVVKRETPDDNDWSVYFDDVRVFNHEDIMIRASLIYAGGEFTQDVNRACFGLTCPPAQVGCASAGYGLDGTLRWQRATTPLFRTAFTIQSSYWRNDRNKWRTGDIPGGFIIRARANCP
jgi:hypothetical protein